MLVPASVWPAGFGAAEAAVLSATMGMSTTTAVVATLATSLFAFTSAPLVRTAFVAVMVILKEPFPQNFPNAVVVHERPGS